MKPIKRILLEDDQAMQVTELVHRLRSESCRVDASKVVSALVRLFLEKASDSDFEVLKTLFFDKKSYLRKLISSTDGEDIDGSIQQYLKLSRTKKKKVRKKSDNQNSGVIDEAQSA